MIGDHQAEATSGVPQPPRRVEQPTACCSSVRSAPSRLKVAVGWVLLLGLLEGAVVGEIIVVNDPVSSSAGSPTTCQLGDAIEAANSDLPVGGCVGGSAGMDTIVFDPALGEVNLSSSLPEITDDLAIVGPGPETLAIVGGFLDDLFEFVDGTVGAVVGLTIRDGDPLGATSCLASRGDAFLMEDVVIERCEETAASFVAVGDLQMRRVVLRDHTYTDAVPALEISGTTGLVEDLLVHGTTCAITSSACAVRLGSAGVGADLTMRRVTLTDNEGGDGVGIAVISTASALVLEHSTISGNRIHSSFLDHSIVRTNGALTIRNTIVAGNSRVGSGAAAGSIEVRGAGTVTSSGNNLIGSNQDTATTFPAGTPNGGGDYAGTHLSPLLPGLMALADNGGPMWTMMPINLSLAVDSGNCPGEIFDQRGYNNHSTGLRAVNIPGAANDDDGCDIGAVERNASPGWIFGDGFESSDASAWSP